MAGKDPLVGKTALTSVRFMSVIKSGKTAGDGAFHEGKCC